MAAFEDVEKDIKFCRKYGILYGMDLCNIAEISKKHTPLTSYKTSEMVISYF